MTPDNARPANARPAPPKPNTEARLGDRGGASGRNIQQDRAIGQDDPVEGSRMGREANKKTGFPGDPTVETKRQEAG